ncbi:contact-dependent growth inhibition system immunity protein [Flavobacteriaceae bacterium S356]|uniref:Contact-dependent growth inhibition system immunity protein n=1 Tax=Asprobacillus argus TaxID=3076534 RepID=A0ABU3LGF5_9FLAO|nr:contact-dependent growth inhibition system immunity protein [Flavobacteriaceae bacterium S356]
MKMKTHLTLEQLESEYWGEPQFHSNVVVTCHKLRRKALRDFKVEDLRTLIGQGFSLKYMIPLAIEKLNENILVEATFYEGDLLMSVIDETCKEYWLENIKEWKKLKTFIKVKKEFFSDRMFSEIEGKIKFIES